MAVVHIMGLAVAGLALAGALYTALTAILACRFRATPDKAAASLPPMSVLKPLHGDEPALDLNLETYFVQDYPAPYQLLFGVQSRSDAAIATVERLRARHPEVDATLVIDGRSHGTNAKVSNLVNMSASIRHGLVVVSDSDISVPPTYLRELAVALEPDTVGAVTCPYTGWAARGAGSLFCAMGINFHFLPNALAGVALGLVTPCFGSTIAVKGAVLAEIGGFAAFANFLADDYEIGRAVRATGRRVPVAPPMVRHACGENSLSEWFSHELRWQRTTRVIAAAGHAGSIITYPIPLGLLGAILLGFSGFGVAVLATTVLSRVVLKWRLERHFGFDGGSFWMLPAADLLSFAIFLVSLFGGRVEWRGARLKVDHDGALLQR
ncbi:MAG: bacteriohopanetetrol glucosamine biosynthesis glycosyltransferase HpnI [Alphaproteobacteria bacterium]|nr:bacteriohopanetetrol glucosamine biosynthesis glycosyltransferase HpnI [Alphaproteobacteria bacterium]